MEEGSQRDRRDRRVAQCGINQIKILVPNAPLRMSGVETRYKVVGYGRVSLGGGGR